MAQQLPQTVQAFLQKYLRQRDGLLLWRGLLRLLVATFAWVAMWCLIDRSMQLSSAWRYLIFAVTLGGVALWGALTLKQLLAGRDPEQAALELERLLPDLDGRLATLCSRLADRRELASSELLEKLSQEVQQYIATHGPPRLIRLANLRRPLISAGMACIVAGWLFLFPLLGMPQLLGRILLPWSATAPVTTTRLIPLYEADLAVREGETLPLEIAVERPGEKGVFYNFSTDGKTWASRAMESVDPNRYRAQVGPISASERFYISSGDARTPDSTIQLLRRPAVAEFRIRYEYPDYMKRDPIIARNTDGLIEAPVGARAAIQIVAGEPLASASLWAKDFALPLHATDEPSVMQGFLTVTRDQSYEVKMTSSRGIEGAGPQGAQIRAIPDRPPLIQLIAPQQDLRLSPREIASVRFHALDDYGVGRLTMRLQVNNTQPLDIPIRLAGDGRSNQGEQALDLADFALRIGDVVAVTLLASDGAAQESQSQTRYLFISPHSIHTADYERLSEMQRSLEHSRQISQKLDAAIRLLKPARPDRPRAETSPQAIDEYRQNIADVGLHAEALRQSLTRALARSRDRAVNDALANIADQAQVRMIEGHELMDELGRNEASEHAALRQLSAALEQSRKATNLLSHLASSELASAALADRRNLMTAQGRLGRQELSSQLTEMMARMRQDVDDQTRQLGLAPENPAIESQLNAIVRNSAAVAKGFPRLDLVSAAGSWSEQILEQTEHAPVFDRRLAAAADVESVRLDGAFQHAWDLNLSASAAQSVWLMSRDPAARIASEKARKEFVAALSDLETLHATKQPSADLIRRGNEAREKMAQLAGQLPSIAESDHGGADEVRRRELAMEANQQLIVGRYDRASELQLRMAMEHQQAMQAAMALRDARAADELQQAQQSVLQRLQNEQAEAAALANRQREVASRIDAHMRSMNQTPAPRDTRQEALIAIQAIQERLALMPQQLQDATTVAQNQLQAHNTAQAQQSLLATAPAEGKPAAQRAADRAAAAEAEALAQTQAALVPVAADVTAAMVSTLSEFYPETIHAGSVLEGKLASALQKLAAAIKENNSQEIHRSVQSARQAIAESQAALRQAQDSLFDRDPLFAARVYAQAAADALSRVPPDMKSAAKNQDLAASSLSRQRDLSIRQASAAHLSSIGQFRDVFAVETASEAIGANRAISRTWGALRERLDENISAATHQQDPSGHQKMLQVYFRALGRPAEQEQK